VRTFSRLLWSATAGTCLLFFGCGDVGVGTVEQSVDPQIQGKTDTADSGQVATDTGGSSSGGGSGIGCLSNNDCSSVKGQTPCRKAKCVGAKLPDVEGKCTLSSHPAGTACIDTSLPPNECLEQLCDKDGECKAQPRPKTAACDDQNVTATECQQKRCDGKGECALQNLEDDTGCKGAFACGTVCKAGKCTVQGAADYDDKNPCTNDYCKDGTAIMHDKIDDLTTSCDDGDNCTGDEHCATGVCKGKALTCNDGHTCTADSCDKDKGCVNAPNDKKCATDSDPCAVQGCDKEKGCTAKSFRKGAKCDDGDKCTENDACDDKGAALLG
jgi:hypothetical protein